MVGKCLIALGAFLPQIGVAQEMASVVSSPYELAQFVATNTNFDWAPIWRALHLDANQVFLPRCEASFRGVPPCSSELITVKSPFQIIVVIRHEASQFQALLRYENVQPEVWRVTGAYSPYVKYFPPEHRMLAFGMKPFLIVTSQGNAGSGLSSRKEEWLDLTARRFEPVLSFTLHGQKAPFPGGIGQKVRGLVIAMATQPTERITLSMNIEFLAFQSGKDPISIGGREDQIVYSRQDTGQFQFEGRLSTATKTELGTFYYDLDSGYSDEEFLKFNLKGLLAVANGRDQKARVWLSDYLRRCPDTSDARQLKQAMAASR